MRLLTLKMEENIKNRNISSRHIQEMLIPVPSDWSYAKKIIDAGNEFIHAMECMSVADKMVREDGLDVMLKNEVAE